MHKTNFEGIMWKNIRIILSPVSLCCMIPPVEKATAGVSAHLQFMVE